MRRFIVAVTAAAIIMALAAPSVSAATVNYGRRLTLIDHPAGSATGRVACVAVGQVIDNDNIRGRTACVEYRGAKRLRDYYRLLKVWRNDWVTVARSDTDVVATQTTAHFSADTPSRALCQVNTTARRWYQVQHATAVRWNNDQVTTKTMWSEKFQAPVLENDPLCVPPAQGKLDLALSANPPSPLVGEPFTLVAAAKNIGGRVVEEPTFTIDLPDTWTVADATVAGGTCTVNHTTNVVACALGALLDAGAERDVSIHVTSAPGADTFTLLGILSSTTEGVATDTATLSLTVRPSADLSVVKAATGTPVADVDSDFSYVLTVDNAGPSSASGVTVTDTWPAGLDNPATPLPAGCTFNDPDPATNTGETITCTIASLVPGVSSDATFVFHARTNGEASGDLTNTATVSSDTPDPDTSNNSATLTIDVA